MNNSLTPLDFSDADPNHVLYMERCLRLATLGGGQTAPNPMVGAVLVYKNKIIGEGYHARYGGPHAEVNCIRSVKESDRLLIPESTLYVSLEPCAHTGKTPPCADLIIREKIPRVVIGCRDPFTQVDGKGIEKLQSQGVELIYPLLENKCLYLNRRFMRFHAAHRPYIILKWAQSANQKIAGADGARVSISNVVSNRLVHQWRSEESGILIGSGTATADNPQLTNRLWTGKNPVRIVIDRYQKLESNLHIFDRFVPTLVFNFEKESSHQNLQYKKVEPGVELLPQVLSGLYQENILSVLVEGGAQILKLFIESGLWDEARVITNNELQIENGLSSPEFFHASIIKTEKYLSDTIVYYQNEKIRNVI